MVINVPAGDWAVFAEGSQPPAMISAKQTSESSTTPPTAAAKIELGDFYFNGLSEGLKPGPQVWEVTNTGKQIQMSVVGKVPEGTTEQQVIDTFSKRIPAHRSPAPCRIQTSSRLARACCSCRRGRRSTFRPISRRARTLRFAL